MQILKKIAFYLFITLSISGAIWGYYKLKESKEPNATVLEHISNKALFLIETNNYSDFINQLIRQNVIWNNLSENSDFKLSEKTVLYFDSLVSENKKFKAILNNNALYFSCYKKETLKYLLQFKLKEKNEKTYFESFFKTNLHQEKTISTFNCYSSTIQNIKWYILESEGIVYFSNDIGILEESINLKKEESIAFNESYKKLLKASGKQNNCIYYNQNVSSISNSTILNSPSVFNFELNLNQITLSGYSSIDTNSIYNSLKKQSTQVLDFFDELPNNPISITAISLNNESFINQTPLLNSWKSLNDSALYNIQNEFFSTIDVGIVNANYKINESIESISIIKSNDVKKNTQLLKLISDSTFTDNDIKCFHIKSDYTNLFSFLNSNQKNNFICINNSSLCFFNSKDALNNYILQYKNGNTLYKNKQFMNYATNNLLVDCNYLHFENSEELLKNNLPSLINSNSLKLKKTAYNYLSLIAKNSKDFMQIRINLSNDNIKPDSLNTTNYLWTFVTDSIIKSNLSVFTNHLTKEKEIVFQDNDNNLYLISSTGILLWKKKLPEALKSGVFTVDIFKNGKLQLLFNTKNYIHLIDRNGNYVQGYPLKTPSEITSNITLLDYENNNDYRILIACTDKKIYSYTLYAIKTEGFIPYKTNDIVTLPVYYSKIGQSDYLITADIAGKIYAFSRKGLGRIDFKNKTIQNLNHLIITDGNSIDNSKLIYVDDKNDLLCKVSLSDKKEALKLGDNLNDFFTSFKHLNDDSQNDIVCYGNGAIFGYDLFSNKLFEFFNNNAVYKSVDVVNVINNKLIVTFDEINHKVEILNNTKVIKEYINVTKTPLIVDLYKNGKYYLLLSENNKINCVELN